MKVQSRKYDWFLYFQIPFWKGNRWGIDSHISSTFVVQANISIAQAGPQCPGLGCNGGPEPMVGVGLEIMDEAGQGHEGLLVSFGGWQFVRALRDLLCMAVMEQKAQHSTPHGLTPPLDFKWVFTYLVTLNFSQQLCLRFSLCNIICLKFKLMLKKALWMNYYLVQVVIRNEFVDYHEIMKGLSLRSVNWSALGLVLLVVEIPVPVGRRRSSFCIKIFASSARDFIP